MTSLVGGKRVRKDCARLEAYGTVDELNSHLGLLLASLTDETAKNSVVECQNVLFSVGAVLATGEEPARFCIAIHAIYSVSEEMILWATRFAREHGLRIHIHLSETRKEVEDCKNQHNGMSPVEYLDALGVLGEDVIAAHTLWLSACAEQYLDCWRG